VASGFGEAGEDGLIDGAIGSKHGWGVGEVGVCGGECVELILEIETGWRGSSVEKVDRARVALGESVARDAVERGESSAGAG